MHDVKKVRGIHKTLTLAAAIPLLAAATAQAQTYTVSADVTAGAGFFDSYTNVVNTSNFTLTLDPNNVLNGKSVTIAGIGSGNGALNFTQNASSSTTANITLAGDALIRWNRFANLTLSGPIGESAAGSRLTLRGTGVNSSFAGRTFFLNGAQTYTGGLTVDNAKVILQTTSGNLPSGEIRLVNFGGFDLAYGTRTLQGKVVIDNGFAYTSGTPTTLNAQGGYEVNQGVIDGTLGLAGIGNLTKVGAGTFSLNGSNSYSGTTTVTQGTLVVNGTLTAASTVVVESGGTLAGNGTIRGGTTIFGTHRPGNSPGVQTFTSGLTYEDGSGVAWELIGNTDAGRGTNFDGIDLTGEADLAVNGTSVINLVFNGTGSTVDWTDAFWDESRSWMLYSLADGAVTGAFGVGTVSGDSLGVDLATIRDGASFSLETLGNDVYVNYTIPEPAALALLGVGGLMMLTRRTPARA